MKTPTASKITNWAEYNQALVTRGKITFWVDDTVLTSWYSTERTGRRGASNKYSDMAIQTALMLKVLFKLPLRGVEGFLASILELLRLPLQSPDYSTLSKRAKTLRLDIPVPPTGEHRHVVVDSTGLKIYGEGEWKRRKHGWGKRRRWRKLHLAVDAVTHQIVGSLLTSDQCGDSEILPELLKQVTNPIGRVYGDGAYDTHESHDAIAAYGAEPVIPPRDNAAPWDEKHPRTIALQQCIEQGDAEWKRSSGYHKRSLAETAMFRYKQLISQSLAARDFDRQDAEAQAGVAVLNKMSTLAMPVRIAIA